MSVGSVALLSYGAVFAAELIGDKLLYTTGVLAASYRTVPILVGTSLAFMVKMGAAVLLGQAVSRLPPALVALVSGLSFVGVSFAVWLRPCGETRPRRRRSGGLLAAFALVLFSEWADLGQVTAATMSARFGAPVEVWLGATAAMATKGGAAIWLGGSVRRWLGDRVTPRTLRLASVALLLLLGTLSVAESVLSGDR